MHSKHAMECKAWEMHFTKFVYLFFQKFNFLLLKERKISADILFTYSGGSRILKRGVPVGSWLLYLAKRNHESMWSAPTRVVWGHSPQGNFSISDLLRSLLMLFRGKIATVRWLTANLVIVFEVFKHSQNLKVWLHFAPERLQSSREVWRRKKENFS